MILKRNQSGIKMTIKKKSTKPTIYVQTDIEDAIEEVIGRGGKTIEEGKNENKSVYIEENKTTSFTLRIPEKMIGLIDKRRKGRIGKVSRNQWIIEVIQKELNDNT